mmetsp:Transcript_33336/g.56497  ORF Transcript_33336/g.56497 Transcript_33336/m.56497 type:complete len:344 (-) Transcript_33336:73-1104(-)
MAFYEGGSGGYAGYGGGSNNAGGGYNNNFGSNDNFFSGGMGQQQQPQQSTTSQPQQQQQQQQQQQTSANPNAMSGGMNNLFNPAMAMAAANAVATGKMGDNTVMMNMAESMGKQFLETGWAKAVPGLERSMVGLRPYFAVDNKYVKRKMLRVLFPFAFRNSWARQEVGADADGKISYALPQHDDNAPDLYIPTMSLLTYVLLCALCYGTAGKFDPDVLPDVTTKCLGFQVLEVIAIRIGFYLMEAQVPILDLFCYTGYKYLGLVINMFSGITVGHLLGYGHRAYYFTYLWTATAVSYFILKVMANCIPRITSAVGPKRQFMVLGFAASQFATCWFVSQTKFLE